MKENSFNNILLGIAIVCGVIFTFETFLSAIGSSCFNPIISVITILITFITGGFYLARRKFH